MNKVGMIFGFMLQAVFTILLFIIIALTTIFVDYTPREMPQAYEPYLSDVFCEIGLVEEKNEKITMLDDSIAKDNGGRSYGAIVQNEYFGKYYIYLILEESEEYDYAYEMMKNSFIIRSEPFTDEEIKQFENENYYNKEGFLFYFDNCDAMYNYYSDEQRDAYEDAKAELATLYPDCEISYIKENGIHVLCSVESEDIAEVILVKYFNVDGLEIQTFNLENATPEEYSTWLNETYFPTWAEYEIQK